MSSIIIIWHQLSSIIINCHQSSDLENRLKTKILRNFEKSSKTFKYRNFFEDIQRTEDFRKNLKKIRNCRNICIVKKFWWNWSLLKFQHQKVFSIFIKGIYWFSSFFHQNSFNKRGFYLKNLRNLWPKIFEASKILQLLEMGRRRRWIFGQKSLKNTTNPLVRRPATVAEITFFTSDVHWHNHKFNG